MSMIVCLMGPTASGKTDLALELCRHLPFEIISVDSAMVYKNLDIGTAKPKFSDTHNFHYLINICSPNEIYSVGQFCEDAVGAIKTIEKKKHIPILVGGTMMYFRALQKGLSVLPKRNAVIRKKIALLLESEGVERLHEKLSVIDPVTAKKLHPNDAQRITRALEVYEETGIALSVYHQKQKKYLENTRIINIGLIYADREKLKLRIQQRFDKMLEQGFIDEVKNLMSYKDYPCMRSVGYYEVLQYLQNSYNKEMMIQKAVIATCQLAKRQMTWLRNFGDVTFFEADSKTLLQDVLNYIQDKINI